ncbi:MAG: hypothetical protein KIH10_11980 [Candidatus Freyarchaeota archaeon]|nr:hypothetical protein [Candidatus Jordarchaeia archaeon]MBS7280265.1 hypothetical protein [Candidatus Jordarchaeia archaeon]
MDAEVLSLAKELNAIALIDDEESRAMADLEKIPNHGTIYLLFRFLNEAIITKKEFIDKLNEIIKEGWRCSTELYIIIINALDSFWEIFILDHHLILKSYLPYLLFYN